MNAKSMLGAMVMLAASLFLPFEMAGQNQKNEMLKAGYSYPEGSPVFHNGQLSVSGTNLVSECGKVVQLKGMSSHGLAWTPACYTEESLTSLAKDWNVDIFRLAIYTHEWGGYCKTGSQQWKTPEEYNKFIDNLVDICGKLGIYCIIDWHVLNEGSGNPNTTLEYAVPFWEYMSQKHKDDKHVLYEICNEPNGMNVKWETVKKYADTIIPIIRKNDPDKIIICGSPTWSQDVDKAAEDPLQYDNVMYSLHFYSGTHDSYLRDKAEVAMNKGLAIFVTECGTSSASGDGGVFSDEFDEWVNWMNKFKISWLDWSFVDKNETSAGLNPGAVSAKNWTDVSNSGRYIMKKLWEPKGYESCEGVEIINKEYVETFEALSAITSPEGSAAYHNGRLHVSEGHLVNECEKDIQLRGISTGDLSSSWRCIPKSAVENLVNEWNISLFRIVVPTWGASGFCETGDKAWKNTEAYRDFLDRTLNICESLGIYSILDWHVTEGDPNASLKEAVSFWRYAAQRYKNYDHMIFEICSGSTAEWSAMKGYADSIISVIRSYDPTRVVICGIPNKNRDLDDVAANPLKQDNVLYGLSLFSGKDDLSLCDKALSLKTKGLPVFVTEFNPMASASATSVSADMADQVIARMNDNKVSWASAEYSDSGNSISSLLTGSCTSKNWNSVSNYGEYLKKKLMEQIPFESCVDGVENVPFADQINYYPNPVENEFSVVLPENAEADGVEIADVTGRVVYETSSLDMNLASLTSGVYYVKVIFPEGIAVKKILKK